KPASSNMDRTVVYCFQASAPEKAEIGENVTCPPAPPSQSTTPSALSEGTGWPEPLRGSPRRHSDSSKLADTLFSNARRTLRALIALISGSPNNPTENFQCPILACRRAASSTSLGIAPAPW